MKAMLLFSGLGLLCLQQVSAGDRTFTVVTNSALVNHWPSADQFLGTGDDVVDSGLSKFARSSPNAYGSYSYIATSFSNNSDPWLFTNYDAVTFVLGSVTIDTSQFVTNDVPLLKAVQFSGTELFPGHGPYSVRLISRRGGSPSHTGSMFTFNALFDFEGTFLAGTATGTNANASGVAVVLDSVNYDAPDLTGVPDALAGYVRTVAIPLARTMNASGLLCSSMKLQTSGSVPGTAAYFPPLNGSAVVLALDLSSPVAGLKITAAQLTADGLRLEWTPLAGKSYSVQAAGALDSPFATLASGLAETEYLDRDARAQPTRYYRVSAP